MYDISFENNIKFSIIYNYYNNIGNKCPRLIIDGSLEVNLHIHYYSKFKNIPITNYV